MEKMTLARRMSLVSQRCAYVQKDGTNSFHRYKFASAGSILTKVNAALAECGVASFADAQIVSQQRVPTKQGEADQVIVRVAIKLVDVESGESETIAGIGCGQDNGDKAVMKAETAALKYAWTMTLNISTGDDPEADESVDKSAGSAAMKVVTDDSIVAGLIRRYESGEALANVNKDVKAVLSELSDAQLEMIRAAKKAAEGKSQ